MPRPHAEPASSRTIWHSRPLGASIRATPLTRSATASSNGFKERLEAKGYEVVAQVGVAGFWIDLGVRHHEWPYGFLLGIECDGAAYHSSLSARDRDRLRQQVLESLGWTIYRVWSTDWFRDQNRELAKMVDFIERTLADRQKQQVEAEAEHVAFVEAADVEEPDEENPFPPVTTKGKTKEASGTLPSQSADLRP